MDKELEILMELIRQVRDDNDHFTPRQLYNALKNGGYEIRRTPHAAAKVIEKITDVTKAIVL